MKSLPTLLTTKEIQALLGQFPDNATVELHPAWAAVRAPNGDKVLSAIKHPSRALWSVRAKEGLVIARQP